MQKGIRLGLTAGAMSLTAITGAWAQGSPDKRQPAPGRSALELGSDVQRLPWHRSQVLQRLERDPAQQGPDLHPDRRPASCEPRHRADRRREHPGRVLQRLCAVGELPPLNADNVAQAR